MNSDPNLAMLSVLERYFSPPLAKTLLTVTRRREGLEQEANPQLPHIVAALERALPGYLADGGRRDACTRELRKLIQGGAPTGNGHASPGGGAQLTFEISSEQDLHRVTETVRSLSRDLGMSPLDQTKLTTAVSELTRNVLQYAGSGRVFITRLEGRAGLEIVAEDRGPGIADVELVLSARYASRTGMGMGLKGTKRIVDEFQIDSAKGRGTRVLIRKYVN